VTTTDHDIDAFMGSAARLGFEIPLADAQGMGRRFAQVQGALDGLCELDVSRHEPAVTLDLAAIRHGGKKSEGVA